MKGFDIGFTDWAQKNVTKTNFLNLNPTPENNDTVDHLIFTDHLFVKSERLYAVGYRKGKSTLGFAPYYDPVKVEKVIDGGNVAYIGKLPRGGSAGGSGTILVKKKAAVRGGGNQWGAVGFIFQQNIEARKYIAVSYNAIPHIDDIVDNVDHPQGLTHYLDNNDHSNRIERINNKTDAFPTQRAAIPANLGLSGLRDLYDLNPAATKPR